MSEKDVKKIVEKDIEIVEKDVKKIVEKTEEDYRKEIDLNTWDIEEEIGKLGMGENATDYFLTAIIESCHEPCEICTYLRPIQNAFRDQKKWKTHVKEMKTTKTQSTKSKIGKSKGF